MTRSKKGDAVDPDKTVQVRRRSSIGAHALDLAGADSTLETRWYAASARRRRLFWLVSAAVALSGAILIIAFTRRAIAASEGAPPVLSSVTVVGAKLAENPSAATSVQSAPIPAGASALTSAPQGGVPEMDVTSLPKLSTGRLVLVGGARGRRLVVDGAVVSGSPAIVHCGRRAVKVGNRKVRTIDVPCGGDVSIK